MEPTTKPSENSNYSLADALNEVQAEAAAQAQEKPSEDAKAEKDQEASAEIAKAASESSEAQESSEDLTSPPVPEALEGDFPPELLAKYDERIKGYQRSYTKKVQELKAQGAEVIENFKRELEQKYAQSPKSAENAQPSEEVDSQDESLETLLPGADPAQVSMFKKIVSAVVKEKLSSAEKQNQELQSTVKQLTEYINSQQTQSALDAAVQKAIQEFPELASETVQNDLYIWAQENPELIKGKNLQEMYMIKTYREREKIGYQKAMKELKKKEREQLESTSSVSVVEDSGEIDDLAAAFNQAMREKKQKEGK